MTNNAVADRYIYQDHIVHNSTPGGTPNIACQEIHYVLIELMMRPLIFSADGSATFGGALLSTLAPGRDADVAAARHYAALVFNPAARDMSTSFCAERPKKW